MTPFVVYWSETQGNTSLALKSRRHQVIVDFRICGYETQEASLTLKPKARRPVYSLGTFLEQLVVPSTPKGRHSVYSVSCLMSKVSDLETRRR